MWHIKTLGQEQLSILNFYFRHKNTHWKYQFMWLYWHLLLTVMWLKQYEIQCFTWWKEINKCIEEKSVISPKDLNTFLVNMGFISSLTVLCNFSVIIKIIKQATTVWLLNTMWEAPLQDRKKDLHAACYKRYCTLIPESPVVQSIAKRP